MGPFLPAPTGLLDGATGLPTDGILSVDAGDLVATITTAQVADDGGDQITLTSAWPVAVAVSAYVIDGNGGRVACYAGVVGQGNGCLSDDGLTLMCVAPPLPVGSYDMEFETATAAWVTAAPLVVVHRSFSTRLYGLRGATPSPRQCGPRSIRDEVL